MRVKADRCRTRMFLRMHWQEYGSRRKRSHGSASRTVQPLSASRSADSRPASVPACSPVIKATTMPRFVMKIPDGGLAGGSTPHYFRVC